MGVSSAMGSGPLNRRTALTAPASPLNPPWTPPNRFFLPCPLAAKPALRLRRSLMQDPSSPAPAPNAAAGNATPSPAPDASTPTPGADAAGAAGGGNATISSSGGSGSVFPGYPASGGLLHPELSNLLLAIQEAHLYKDSKTAV